MPVVAYLVNVYSHCWWHQKYGAQGLTHLKIICEHWGKLAFCCLLIYIIDINSLKQPNKMYREYRGKISLSQHIWLHVIMSDLWWATRNVYIIIRGGRTWLCVHSDEFRKFSSILVFCARYGALKFLLTSKGNNSNYSCFTCELFSMSTQKAAV